MQQKYIINAWGEAGTITPAIPNDADPSGYVSYAEGFTFDYQRNLLTDPAAKSPTYINFNAFMHDVTLNIQDYQQFGTPEHITTSDNGGVAFSYGIGAMQRYSAGGTAPFGLYVSVTDANTSTPTRQDKWADLLAALRSGKTGQIEISVSSTTVLNIKAKNGNYIQINGQLYKMANATITNSGLAASTLYYLYAFNNAGTVNYEFSATAHSADTATDNYGVEIKTGDATRSLVGMVYTASGTPGTFVDTDAFRCVVNWFNQKSRPLNGSIIGGSTASVTLVELNTAFRVGFLTWANEAVCLSLGAVASNATAGQSTGVAIGIDSTTVASGNVGQMFAASGGNSGGAIAVYNGTLTEGFHFATALGDVSGGTGGFNSGTISGTIQG